MGAATARDLARQGFHVLAGVRRPADGDALRAEGIEPVILDITEPDHIKALVERIASDPDARPLRALVNNAGVSVYAPVEAYPLEEWRRLFEVNLFGHVAMIQALLPALIAGAGRIVNISSVGGKGAMPTYGPYAATKFALEAVSDALRRELSHHGVQVVVVEPGAVQSEMAARGASATSLSAARMRPDLRRRYGDLITAALARTSAHIGRGLSAAAAALRGRRREDHRRCCHDPSTAHAVHGRAGRVRVDRLDSDTPRPPARPGDRRRPSAPPARTPHGADGHRGL